MCSKIFCYIKWFYIAELKRPYLVHYYSEYIMDCEQNLVRNNNMCTYTQVKYNTTKDMKTSVLMENEETLYHCEKVTTLTIALNLHDFKDTYSHKRYISTRITVFLYIWERQYVHETQMLKSTCLSWNASWEIWNGK